MYSPASILAVAQKISAEIDRIDSQRERPRDEIAAYLGLVEERGLKLPLHNPSDAERARTRLLSSLQKTFHSNGERALQGMASDGRFSPETLTRARAQISGEKEVARAFITDVRRRYRAFLPNLQVRHQQILAGCESLSLTELDPKVRRLTGLAQHLSGLLYTPSILGELLVRHPKLLITEPDELIPLMRALADEHRTIEAAIRGGLLKDPLPIPAILALPQDQSIESLRERTVQATKALEAEITVLAAPAADAVREAPSITKETPYDGQLRAITEALDQDPQSHRYGARKIVAIMAAFLNGSQTFISERYTVIYRIRSRAQTIYGGPIEDFHQVVMYLGNRGILMKLNDKGAKQVASIVPSAAKVQHQALREAHRFLMLLTRPAEKSLLVEALKEWAIPAP